MKPTVTVIQPTITEEKEHKIRVAAYCRVSSDSADQLNSYMTQLRYYENFLKDSETEILVNVYADEGITGTRMDKREDFQRMLRDCRKGKIDRIIAKSISRFARNTKECLTVIRELKELGITVVFEKEAIDTANMSDEMIITIMGGLAQEESVSISNNLQWSIQKRMKNGTFNPASLPYGYARINGKVVATEEAKIVESIFSDFLNGIGMETIAKNLNEKNKFKGNGTVEWCKNTIRYILTNEKYTGDSLFQKYYTKSQFPFKQKLNKGERDKYFVADSMPAIISKEDFNTVQHLISQRLNKVNRTKGKTYPLSKKIVCGNCQKSFRRKLINGVECWVCTTHNYKADSCYIKGIEQIKIYIAFLEMYNKLKCHYMHIFPPLLSQLQELKNKKFGGNQKYMDIAKEIANLKEQMHVFARLKTKGFLDEAKYIEQTNEIITKIEKLNRKQRKIVQSDDEDEVIDQIKEIAVIIENGIDLMTEFDEIMFESLVEKIIVKDQTTLEFYLYGGLKFKEELR